MRRIALMLALVAWSSLALAQSVTYVEAGTALNAAADHDGVAVTGYQLYVDDAKSGAAVPPSARGTDGVVRVTIPPLTPGPHKLELASVYVFGTEAKSAPLTVTAVTPSAPGTLRIPVSITVVLPQ